ncbi:MAG: hypothetical protein WCK67_10905, partial [bacterium]
LEQKSSSDEINEVKTYLQALNNLLEEAVDAEANNSQFSLLNEKIETVINTILSNNNSDDLLIIKEVIEDIAVKINDTAKSTQIEQVLAESSKIQEGVHFVSEKLETISAEFSKKEQIQEILELLEQKSSSDEINEVKTYLQSLNNLLKDSIETETGDSQFTLLNEKVKEIVNVILNDTKTQDIAEIKGIIEEISSKINNINHSSEIEQINAEIAKLQDGVHYVSENLITISNENITQIKEEIDTSKNAIIDSNAEAVTIIDESLNRINTAISNILGNIDNNLAQKPEIAYFEQNIKRLETKIDVLADSDITDCIELLISELRNNIEEKQAQLANKIEALTNNASSNSNNIRESLEIIYNNLTDLHSTTSQLNLEEKLNGSLVVLFDEIKTLFSSYENKIDSISEVLNSQNDLSPELNELKDILNLQNEKITIIEHFVKLQPSAEDYSEKLEPLFSQYNNQFDQIIDAINSKATNEALIGELKPILIEQENKIQSLYNYISDITPETDKKINRLIELIEQNNELISSEDKNNELQDNLITMEANLNEIKGTVGLNSTNMSELKSIVKNVQEHIDCYINAESSDYVKTSIHSIIEKIEKINAFASDNTSKSSLEKASSLIEEINDQIQSLKNVDSQLIEQNIISIADQLNAIVEILAINASTSDIEEIKEQLSINNSIMNENASKLELTIIDNITELKQNLNGFEEKLQTLNLSSHSELNDVNDNLRQNMELVKIEIGLFTKKITDIEENLNGSLSASLSGQIGETKDTLLHKYGELSQNISEFQGKIIEIENALTSSQYETSKLFGHSDEILNTVTTLYEIVSNIENITNSINDSSQASEFKLDAVNNKVDDIDVGLIQLSGNIETLSEKVQVFSTEYETIKQNIDTVPEMAQNLSQLNENFAESTKAISNVHSLLTESQNSLKNDNELIHNNFEGLKAEFQNIVEKFNKCNEDVSDISNRTNKLIITSSENSETLKQNLSTFKETFEEIKQKTSGGIEEIQNILNKNFEIPSTEIKNLINENISISKSTLPSALQNTEVIKNAIIQMAEWIDGAGALLEEINARTIDITGNSKDDEILNTVNTLNETLKVLNEKIELNSSISYQNNENLRNVIQNINSSISSIPVETSDSINGRLDLLANQINKSQNTSNITGEINNISSALENFENSLKHDIDKISSKFENSQNLNSKLLNALESNISGTKLEINQEISRLSNKFQSLEQRFERLEEKIDALSEAPTPAKSDEEIKTILEYIAGQVTAGNESGKWKAIVVKKLDNVERRVASFENSIKKMNQFWEE